MVKIDTASIDGLRGVAALHVAIGHMFYFTIGLDFGGGISMGLFFIISGVVMTLGYGQKQYSKDPSMCCDCCCGVFEKRFSCCRDPGQDDDLVDPNDDAPPPFSARRFYLKRAARLGPVYYLTNIVALPLLLLAEKVPFGFLLAQSFLSLFVVTSWVILPPLNNVFWTVSTMAFFYACYPCLVPRLQKMKKVKSFASLSTTMYWTQLLIGIVVVFCFQSAVGYWVWRMFPPFRIPVFIMGCCLGHIRLICETETIEAEDTIEQGNRIHPAIEQSETSDSQPAYPLPDGAISTTAPQTAVKSRSHIGFWVLSADVYAIIFTGCILFITAWNTFLSQEVGAIYRCLGEMITPVLFYDWILALMKPRVADEPYSFSERFLRSKALQWIGRISFSLYACHLLIFGYVVWIIFGYEVGYDGMDRSHNEPPLWVIPVVLVMSVFFGWLVTEYIEIPTQKYIMKRQQDSNQHSVVLTEEKEGEKEEESLPLNTHIVTVTV